MSVKVYKQLATMQDLAIGTGKTTQQRNGVDIELDEIDLQGINDLSQSYIFPTLAAYKASTIEFPVGKTIHLKDSGTDYKVLAGTTSADNIDTLASNTVDQSIQLTKENKATSINRSAQVDNGVADVFLVYGQSNAFGTPSNSVGEIQYINEKAFMYDGANIVPLLNSAMPSQNGGVSIGSAWAAFANEYISRTGRACVFVNCAKGSQSITELSKGEANTNYSGLVAWHNGVIAALTANNNTVGRVSIVFNQGEQDQVLATSHTDYFNKVVQLWADIKADTTATKFFLWTLGTSLSSPLPQGLPIKTAQRRFAESNDDVIIAYDSLGAFSDENGLREGTLHYSQRGYNMMGTEGAKSVVEHFYNESAQESQAALANYGYLSLDKNIRFQTATGVIKKVGGSWVFSNTVGRGASGIVGVDESDPTQLKLLLPQPATQVVTSLCNVGDTELQRNLFVSNGDVANTDELAVPFIPIKFSHSPTIRVKFANGTIDVAASGVTYSSTLNSYSADFSAVGTLVLTHPETSLLSTGSVRDGVSDGVRVVGGATQTTVKCYSGGTTTYDGEVVLQMNQVQLPHADVPEGVEFSVFVVYSLYRQ